jgi:stage II sporulation protein GA (sporulation sigma-E factor processing peptidase)
MAIYIDLLFLENVIVNYGILLVAEKLSGRYSSVIRRFLSSAVGAIYLVVMLLCPKIHSLYSIGGKVLLSVLMVAIAFPCWKVKGWLKALVSFYIASFIFAGAGYALMSLTNQGIYFKNGIFYNQLKSDMLMLILTMIFGFLMVRSFADLFKQRIEKESYIVKTYIHIGDRTACLEALIDTGNSLTDPVSKCPVMVAELEGIADLLPVEMVEWLKNWSGTKETVWESEENLEWKRRIRLIPFNSIGTNHGMLPGFKPDRVSVEKEELQYENTQVVVCICQNRLSVRDQYKAIIGTEMVSA